MTSEDITILNKLSPTELSLGLDHLVKFGSWNEESLSYINKLSIKNDLEIVHLLHQHIENKIRETVWYWQDRCSSLEEENLKLFRKLSL